VVIYGLDPGYEQSALVGWNTDLVSDSKNGAGVFEQRLEANQTLLDHLRRLARGSRGGHLVVERIEAAYGGAGKELFGTEWWCGRFVEAWDAGGNTWSALSRLEVRTALCGSPRAGDPAVRQALLDRHGGKAAALGTRKAPGPLYGIKSHLWAALALAIVARDQVPPP
jgi:hypothetical protein